MAATDSMTLAWINYCCREGYHRQLQTVCLDSLKKYGNDPVLVFWKAFGMLMEENLTEAIREFDSIKEKGDVVLCSLMALVVSYKRSKSVDKETIQQLEAKLKAERTKCGETALYFGAMFLFHSGRADKAREYVDRMLKASPSSPLGLILRGWIDLKSAKEQYQKKSVKYFDEVLNSDHSVKEIDALIGKIEYFKTRNNFSGALELANQLVVMYPEFYPGLMEKMRILIALQDWDQTIETSVRVFQFDSQNIEALNFSILNCICRETNYDQANEYITQLIQALDRLEPKNPYLYAQFAKCYSRLCGRNQNILQQSFTLIDRARSISPKNADFFNEAAYQLSLQGKLKDSLKYYRQAMKIDESSIQALTGIIQCQIVQDQLDEAQQQLEFFKEIQTSFGQSAEILYLYALFAMKKVKPAEEVMQLLQDTVENHFSSLSGIPLGSKYFEMLNPDFLLQIVEMFLMYAPSEPSGTTHSNDVALRKCALILEPIVKTVPGLMQAIYVFAKVKYVAGDIENAKTILQKCLESDPTFVNAHILMAQIHLFRNNFSACEASLENGLSHNFEVKDSPIYHIIKAKIQKQQNNLEEAMKTLKITMNLPGMSSRIGSAGKSAKKTNISIANRVTVYLELADIQRQLNLSHEATKTMQDAINEFAGTPEEIKVTIANAEFSLARGDVEDALTSLRHITPEQSYYVQAREKMAEIYLKYRKDKRLYTSVYRELIDKKPSPETYLLLGDAYMSIQEPEKAIDVYETALKKNPKDASLARKIGKAFIKTHQYSKAISYYEAAVRSGNQDFLRFDLSELHMKLKNFDKAERILKMALKEENSTDITKLICDAKCSFLLGQIYLKTNDSEEAIQTYLKARDLQGRVIKRVGLEQPDEVTAQKAQAAKICSAIGEYYASIKDSERAIKSYKEAIFYNDGDVTSTLHLAKLYLVNNDLDACQHQLVTLLKNNKDCDQATLMLADLMFQKNEYDAATFHFQQILEKNPNYYEALARLVELMRRAGKIAECEKYLEQAKVSNPRASLEAGYNFCKGLYEWYQNNASEALKHFNLARKDNFWGVKALYNMVEICLNPDSDILGGGTLDASEESSAAEKQDSEQMAIKTAEKLLKDVKPQGNEMKHKILENYLLMSTKNYNLVQKALANFMEIAQAEKDYVPSLLGMATAYMIMKQVPKARNQLKRVAKMQWYSEDADDFEKCWLLLADIYIQGGKYDMAQELLTKCLKYNKSCAKAWEYLGFVMEKEQSYKDAAENYENAWNYTNESCPAIGYRLAFNYLKAKRFVDAIDVCHKVLGKHPSYPKIKKEILDKARASLRS